MLPTALNHSFCHPLHIDLHERTSRLNRLNRLRRGVRAQSIAGFVVPEECRLETTVST